MNKQEFIKKLASLLEYLDFSEEVKSESLQYIDDNYNFISKVSKKAYTEKEDDYLTNVKDPYDSLIILIYKIVDLDQVYRQNQFPQSVFIDTLSDLTLRQKMYFKEHNELGLSEEDIFWLKHIYHLEIFKLGALQYELGNMSYQECSSDIDLEDAKQKLPQGSSILRVHIRRGVDLRKEEIDKSFDFSKEFFKTHYHDYEYLAYTCSSWMLYSKNSLLLSPMSNIVNFASRFKMLCETQRSDMSIKYIFGREYENISDYPKETSLQRKALKNFDILGVGYGVIYIQ